MVLLCDGRMVCGCSDPYGKRVLGDTRTATVAGDLDRRARRRPCGATSTPAARSSAATAPLKLPLKKDEAPPQRPSTSAPLPSRLYIECTAACNISCAQACCAPETGITRTRQAGMLDFDLFTRVVDEAGPSLGAHRLLQLRRSVPAQARASRCASTSSRASRTSTSTPAPTAWRSPRTRSRRLVHSGIDEVTFSIDGATAESYVEVPAARRLRQGDPQPARAPRTRSGAPAATCRSSTGATSCSRTTTATRRWTLARADGGRDRRRSPVLGADRSSRGHVLAPLRAAARRSSTRIRHEIWDDNNLGNAIPGATPRARDPRRRSAARPAGDRPAADAPVAARRRRIVNLSTRPFPAQASYGRRLVRLGAQLCARGRRADQPRLRARLAAGNARSRARRSTSRSRSPRPAKPGRYR